MANRRGRRTCRESQVDDDLADLTIENVSARVLA